MTSIAVVSGDEVDQLDDSWPLIRQALMVEGMEPRVAPWTDPAVDWSRFALALVIYVWGYVVQRREFLDWAERVTSQTRLVNPIPVLTWNSDKTYLSDLEGDGVPVVPTLWVPPGATWHPPADDYVVKPSVASGGRGAARYGSHGAVAADHVRRLHAEGQTVMIQPYQAAVDAVGETALVFIDGRYSHAAGKQALLQSDAGETERLWERQLVGPIEPRNHQRATAEAALDAVRRRVGPTAYARVDLVDDGDGRPLVLEVELIEPALFLPPDGAAAGRLARCLRVRAEAASRGTD